MSSDLISLRKTFADWPRFAAYLSGGWFEEYVYSQLKPYAEAGVIQDLRDLPRLRPEISDYLDFLDAQLLFKREPGAEAAEALGKALA